MAALWNIPTASNETETTADFLISSPLFEQNLHFEIPALDQRNFEAASEVYEGSVFEESEADG